MRVGGKYEVDMEPEDITALSVIEDAETSNRFVLYTTREGVEIDCRFDGENPWFTERDLARMFGVDEDTARDHIARFIEDGEIDAATRGKFPLVRTEGNRQVTRDVFHYNLDVAFYVGYRVNSTEGKLFRRWATTMLVQLATKGFVVNKRALKAGENADRIRELRDIVKDLRSEETNLYAELTTICTMCQDYDPRSEDARKFFKFMQAKVFYAAVSMTPAQVIRGRAHADKPEMGLQVWSGDRLLQKDVTVGKNYLAPPEIDALNRVTSIILDVFDDQLKEQRLTKMADCSDLLDAQLKQLKRPVLVKVPPPEREDADDHAKAQYKLFDLRRRTLKKVEMDKGLAALKSEAAALPKPKRTTKAKR